MHFVADEGYLPIVEVLIELELNPFEKDIVSSSCCVSMMVVFVNRRAKRQESWL